MKKILIGVIAMQLIHNGLASSVSYDVVGKTYDVTRCADPEVMAELVEYMQPEAGKKYLDVSCGSGNYTAALYRAGLDIKGIDISEGMLNKAKAKEPNIEWLHGNAQSLPFPDNSFDGVFCIHAIHHYKDVEAAFKEMNRVLVPGGKLIVFTTFVEQVEKQWICHYFPLVLELGRKFIKPGEVLIKQLKSAGFETVRCEKYFVTKNTKDLTIYGGKYQPEVYLNPVVRAGMTPFNMPEHEGSFEDGLIALQHDIQSGQIENVIARHESDLGEHVYMITTK